MIRFIEYRKPGKYRSSQWCEMDNLRYQTTVRESFNIIRDNPDRDFIYINKTENKDVTREKLLSMIKMRELELAGPDRVKYLNKLIRGGGLLETLRNGKTFD